jgi:beta-N-acetylhexosaminidase
MRQSAHTRRPSIFTENGDWPGQAAALDDLRISLREAGRVDQAISAHQAAVGLPPETGARLAADNMPITDAPEAGALNSVGSTQHRTLRAALAGMDLMLCAAQSLTQGQQAAGELATDYTSGTVDRATFQAAVNRVIALRESLK